MKVSELCELLGVDDKHVYRLDARRKLSSFHVGGSVRFDSQEVANLLRLKYASEVEPRATPPFRVGPQESSGSILPEHCIRLSYLTILQTQAVVRYRSYRPLEVLQ
jgi:excisionase family DNA binding protein